MNNDIFLQNYQHLQYGIMYNKLVDLGFASIAWCNKYDSHFFNHAQTNQLLNKKKLNAIEKTLMGFDRKPAVYFENSDKLKSLEEFLRQRGYKRQWEDSWMFHSGDNIDTNKFACVKKVENEQALKEFLETFDNCYQKDDPQNPYGELGNYLEVADEAWHSHTKSGKLEYFTIYKNNRAVAVSTLTNFAGIGYISNVGSLKEIRGQGFGKIASLYCVFKSKKNGNKLHVLATEEGQYPNEFYKRIGFQTKFTAVGYTKEMEQSFPKNKVALSDVILELHVPDFDIVKDFYGKLGFEKVWEYPPKGQSGYLVMKRHNSILAFFCGNEEVYNHSFFKRFPKTTQRGYGVEICIYISDQDVDTYYKHVLKTIGKKYIITPLEVKPWGSKDFRMIDPFGYYLCVRESGNILHE